MEQKDEVSVEETQEESTNRRNMLRGLGAAAAGAAVGGIAFGRPAAADDGVGLIVGSETQVSSSPTWLITDSDYTATESVGIFHVTDNAAVDPNVAAGVSVVASGADADVAFSGSASSVGAALDAPIPLQLTDASLSGPPNQSVGVQGQFKVDNGDLWFCVSSAGTNRWRKLTAPAAAGAFHAVTPFRAYDSRATNPVGNVGILNANANRTVSIKDKRDASGVVVQSNVVPAGATAIAANVTVAGTTGVFGFISVNPGGNTSQDTSSLNWVAANQIIANGLILTLDAARQVTVVCGLGGGNTHFFIDVNGYWI